MNSNAQIILYKNDKGDKHVDMPLPTYKSIRETILVCDSTLESKNNELFTYDSLLRIYNQQLILRDKTLEKKDSTIQNLSTNYNKTQTQNKIDLEIAQKNALKQGFLYGSSAGIVLMFLINLLAK